MKVIHLGETFSVSAGIALSEIVLTRSDEFSSVVELGTLVGGMAGCIVGLGLTYQNPNHPSSLFFPVMLFSVTVGTIVGISSYQI